jgi:hypothetical protein
MLPVYARAKVCDCRGESASKRNGISFVRNRVGADDLECLSGKYVPDVAIKQRVNHHAAGGREAGELKTARGRNQRLARRSDIVENDRSTSRVGGYVWQRDADFAVSRPGLGQDKVRRVDQSGDAFDPLLALDVGSNHDWVRDIGFDPARDRGGGMNDPRGNGIDRAQRCIAVQVWIHRDQPVEAVRQQSGKSSRGDRLAWLEAPILTHISDGMARLSGFANEHNRMTERPVTSVTKRR